MLILLSAGFSLATFAAENAAAPASAPFEGVSALVHGGAPDLALRLLEELQPSPAERVEWMAWEKQRIAIHRERRDWQAIEERAQAVPPGLPQSFVHWILGEAVQAKLRSGDSEGARRILRRLLWQDQARAEQAARWRRLIIRSYLVEDNLTDAQAAVLRYKQDFNARNDAWTLLHAEILLRAQHPRAAFDLLAGMQSYRGRLLRLLAGVRSGIEKPAAVMDAASVLISQTGKHPGIRRLAWAVVAEAAAVAQDGVVRILALENMFSLDGYPSDDDRLFNLAAEDLWRAYNTLAVHLGNSLRLLIGRHEDWLRKAEYYHSAKPAQADRQLMGQSRNRIYARAIYAFLAVNAGDEAVRVMSHEQFVSSLAANDRGRTALALYASQVQFRSLEDIPGAVRSRLAEQALKVHNIKLAAELIADLTAPPQGEDADSWALRRARVLIYAGEFKPALMALSGIVDDKVRLEIPFAERYVQVLFDLQAAGRHEDALMFLEAVYARVHNKRIRRELLFWMGDSHLARGDYAKAAEYYMRSASHAGAGNGDMWGQTARFHAAGALDKAGMIDDARRVYSKLLAHTGDPKQRLVIERNLRQLWLRERTSTTP